MSEIIPPRLHTGRLSLRALTRDDIPAMLPLIADYEVSRWLVPVPHPYTRADAEEFLSYLKTCPNRWSALAIHGPGGFMGLVGVDGRLGYWLGRPFHGQGYMTEAAGALVAAWFDDTGAETLHSGYFDGNAASARVLKKLGFVPDGEDRRYCRAQDTDLDHQNVVLSRTEWEARHG